MHRVQSHVGPVIHPAWVEDEEAQDEEMPPPSYQETVGASYPEETPHGDVEMAPGDGEEADARAGMDNPVFELL
jgi:hypothetical protein